MLKIGQQVGASRCRSGKTIIINNKLGKISKFLQLFITLPKVSRQNIQDNERNIWGVYSST